MTKAKLSNTIGKIMISKRIRLSICESCTGGMLGSIITSVPGSSRYFQGGVIAYSNKIKTAIVKVRKITLKRHGAVSKQAAQEMAQNIKKHMKTEIGLSITGIAGPGGAMKNKPVGLVYIGFSWWKQTCVKQFIFPGNREQIRLKACQAALELLQDELTRKS
jgi:PncC family amidohydrolase